MGTRPLDVTRRRLAFVVATVAMALGAALAVRFAFVSSRYEMGSAASGGNITCRAFGRNSGLFAITDLSGKRPTIHGAKLLSGCIAHARRLTYAAGGLFVLGGVGAVVALRAGKVGSF